DEESYTYCLRNPPPTSLPLCRSSAVAYSFLLWRNSLYGYALSSSTLSILFLEIEKEPFQVLSISWWR
ncbi:MAG: hypothetical protein RR973_07255, partial [Anaerovoracaceae bacterium]